MSIVQEALKKAEDPKGAGMEQGRNKKSMAPGILLVIFILLLGVVIKEVFLSPEGGRKVTSAIDVKAGLLPIAETYTESATARKVSKGKFPDFILSGIMELVDGPRAIINNVIVATGDMIGGATVKKIDKDKVVLQKKNSVVTLGME